MDNVLQFDGDESSPIEKSYYYDLDEFKDIMNANNGSTNLSVLNLNARSLVKHFNEFSAILEDLPSSFDLITVEETWLSKPLEPLVQLNGYSFISKHKNKCKEGGGIGIYIKDGINFTERNDLMCPKEFENLFDYMFIEVQQSAPLKNVLVGVLYRPPGNSSVNTLTTHMKTLLPKLTDENKNIILTSDMNINLLQTSNHNPTSYYYDTLLSCGFLPKITAPTRVTHNTATLIDHIFINERTSSQSFAGTITLSMTDHYFNFIFLKDSLKTERPKTVTYRPFTELNISKFNEALKSANFSKVLESNDPNDAYDNMISIYKELLDKVIPLKTVRFNRYKHNLNPWVSKGILCSIKHRDNLHKKNKEGQNSKKTSRLRKGI